MATSSIDGLGHSGHGNGKRANFISTAAYGGNDTPVDAFVSVFAFDNGFEKAHGTNVDMTPEDAIKFATSILQSAQEAIARRK